MERWIILVPFMWVIGFVVFLRGRHSMHAKFAHCSHERTRPRRCSPFRFFPIVVVCLVGSFLMARASKRHIDIESDPQSVSSELSNEEAESLLAQIINGRSNPPSQILVSAPNEADENLSPADSEPGSTDPNDSNPFPVTVFQTSGSNGERAAELPEWALQDETSDGLPAVITTGPQATTEDAEAEALTLLSDALAEAFVRDHSEASGWSPPVEIVQDLGAVQRRAIEESEITVGDFTEPVFRAYWEVVPPPDLTERLFDAWRAEEVQSRLWQVGGGMGLLTLLFASLAGYFRIDDATGGRYRNKLRWGTAAVWIAAGSTLAIIA